MPVNEVAIHKTAFQAGSSGLYEFTRMPFWIVKFGIQFLPPDGDVLRGPAVCHLDVVPVQYMHLCCQCQ